MTVLNLGSKLFSPRKRISSVSRLFLKPKNRKRQVVINARECLRQSVKLQASICCFNMRTRFLFSEGFGFDLDVPPFPLPPKTPNAMGNPDYPLSKYRKDLILTSRDFSSNEINNDIFKKKKNKIAKAKKSFQNPKHEKLIKKYFFAMSKKVFCLRFRSPLPTGLKFKKILITKFVPILVTSLFVEKQLITITVKVRMLSQ